MEHVGYHSNQCPPLLLSIIVINTLHLLTGWDLNDSPSTHGTNPPVIWPLHFQLLMSSLPFHSTKLAITQHTTTFLRATQTTAVLSTARVFEWLSNTVNLPPDWLKVMSQQITQCMVVQYCTVWHNIGCDYIMHEQCQCINYVLKTIIVLILVH